MKPLHLATRLTLPDEYQPAMYYIQVKEGYVNVTNSEILIKCPVDEVFTDRFSDNPIIENTEELYFSALDWKNAKFSKATSFIRKDNVFEAFSRGKELGRVIAATKEEFSEKVKCSFPNINVPIPTFPIEPKNESFFALNLKMLSHLYEAFGEEAMYLRMVFTGHGKPILVLSVISRTIGLIMPYTGLSDITEDDSRFTTYKPGPGPEVEVEVSEYAKDESITESDYSNLL